MLTQAEYTENMETVDYTAITTCDSCHDRAPCRVFHDALAVPVTTQCRHCEPAAYEAIARVEIDWFLRTWRLPPTVPPRCLCTVGTGLPQGSILGATPGSIGGRHKFVERRARTGTGEV